MRLDDRLQALAELVAAGARVADIGTDHGYLALELVESGRAAFVVAGDKNIGPCEAARRTVREAALADGLVDVRCGDGLAVLAPGEVDTVCIAGMGGVLMTEILAAHPEVMERLDALILQPMNGAYELREWLYKNGWHIAEERLAIADGRLYAIMRAERGAEDVPSRIDLLIGPRLWENRASEKLLAQHIEALLATERRVLAGMARSEAAQATPKFKQVEQTIKELEARLKW